MHRKSAILCAALLLSLPLMTACSQTNTQSGSLSIPLADLSSTPQFFDWNSGGTAMQVIARLDSDGTPRLAYNTCQVCAGSPYAYFELKNGWLICQNCGNAFSPDSVGKVSGGCNPKPVAEYDTGADSVTLSSETLAAAAPLFKNWKAVK